MTAEASAGEVSAAVIIIGNEILSGRTQDANLAYLAGRLSEVGIRVREARIVPDDEPWIVEAVNSCRAAHAHVFTTGGIGPTHDDITARAIASAFRVPFGRNAEAERRLRGYYDPEMINAARLSMADMPQGVELIDNPVSVAPGFRIANVYVLPGVPKILQAMVDGLVPGLAGGGAIVSRSVTVLAAEGDLASALQAIEARYPTVEVGSYPFFRQGRFGTTIVSRGRDGHAVDGCHADLLAFARAAGYDTPEYDTTVST